MPAIGDQHRDPPNAMAVTANPFDEGPRRISEYTAQEVATLQSRLDKQLGPEYISSRSGPSGQKVHYLAAEKCINLANEVFGFNGWSSSIQSIQIDFVDESPNTGKISLGLSVIVRVTLRDGTFHEDVGYGHIENCKGKAAAFEKAKKEGTTDGLKRALRTFGNVLGNCIYDKDYLGRVTRLKVTPSKWDAENLHRHPDFAPTKRETVQDKKTSDVELPPRPSGSNARKENIPLDASVTFDGDGEFGSDVFDEADFVSTNTGNPDEIAIDVENQQHPQQPQTRPQGQQRPQGFQIRPAASHSALVTPSKSERPWVASPAPAAAAQAAHAAYQGNHSSHTAMPQTAGFARNAQIPSQPSHSGNGNSSQDFRRPQNNTVGDAQAVNPTHPPNSLGEDQAPTTNDQKNSNVPGDTPVGFYSARAVDILRENPRASPMAPKFDPHAESPSIRKTAGIDHTKSVPVSRPMIFSSSPSATTGANSARNFINPSADVHRRIGAPNASSATASPVNKGFTTSSYRPLTRPMLDNRSATGNNTASAAAAGTTAQGPNLKRPPLNDVTNASFAGGSTGDGAGDIKRPRLSTDTNDRVQTNAVPQKPQQQ